jgi:hypothetical protein
MDPKHEAIIAQSRLLLARAQFLLQRHGSCPAPSAPAAPGSTRPPEGRRQAAK